MKTMWRAIHIECPEPLIPVYDRMAEVFNIILSAPHLREGVLSVDTSLRRGNYVNEMRRVIGDNVRELLGSDFPNRAWHCKMIFEQLRRMVESLRERQIIFDTLGGGDPDSLFWARVNEQGVYPTMGTVANVRDSSNRPELPRKALFVLDYSASNTQMFRQHGHTFQAKTIDNEWIEFSVFLPLSTREGATGTVAKPRFRRTLDGHYIGDLAYEVETSPAPSDGSVLGVDLGKVKDFSAVVLQPDGETSQEYVPSKIIGRLDKKINDLNREKISVRSKCWRAKPYIDSPHSQTDSVDRDSRRRNQLRNISSKIVRLKMERSRLIARDLVSIAVDNHCSEIHVENLSWLKSKAGRWEHSLIQQHIREAAEIHGITVVKVNAAHTSRQHPITEEYGEWRGRDVVFSDSECLDRDHLASVNIARRGRKPRSVTHICRASSKRARPPSRARIRKRMRELLHAREDQIVSLSPAAPGTTPFHERWTTVIVDASTMSMRRHRPPVRNHDGIKKLQRLV